jgi:hypothetical protein
MSLLASKNVTVSGGHGIQTGGNIRVVSGIGKYYGSSQISTASIFERNSGDMLFSTANGYGSGSNFIIAGKQIQPKKNSLIIKAGSSRKYGGSIKLVSGSTNRATGGLLKLVSEKSIRQSGSIALATEKGVSSAPITIASGTSMLQSSSLLTTVGNGNQGGVLSIKSGLSMQKSGTIKLLTGPSKTLTGSVIIKSGDSERSRSGNVRIFSHDAEESASVNIGTGIAEATDSGSIRVKSKSLSIHSGSSMKTSVVNVGIGKSIGHNGG